MAATAQASLPMPDISCVNPLLHRTALERLFAEHGRAEHAEFFGRAYPGAVAEGAKAWIGSDATGRIVMHASRFPHAFVFGKEKVIGGLIVNIMVAKPYRTHYPARALFERFVADSRTDGEVDFLYTETTTRGANVLTGAGARIVGRIGRFVLPISGAGQVSDVAIRAYHRLRAVGSGAGLLKASEYAAAEFCSESVDAPLGVSKRLRGLHGTNLYRRRLTGFPSPLDRWITVQGSTGTAGALLRGPAQDGIMSIVKLNYSATLTAAAVVHAMTPIVRRMGCRIVQIHTIAESQFAAELRRAGFVERESQPLLALPLSGVGHDVVSEIAAWQITQLDLDS